MRLFCLFLLMIVLVPTSLQAQTVVRHADPGQTLSARWAWAEAEARRQGWQTYLVGYGIERMMGENSYMGHFGRHWEEEVTLHEMIYGEKPPDHEEHPSEEAALQAAARRALERMEDHHEDEQIVRKEIALLFRVDVRDDEPLELDVSNLTLHYPLKGRPLIWLGPANDAESIAWLQGRFAEAKGRDYKEELVMAVGIHEDKPRTFPFLRAVLTGDESDDVREKAAFWMGQQDTRAALDLLVQTAQNDRSGDVREQAVFGLSQLEMEAAIEALIDLARRARDSEVREKALFWLGQKASKKAIAALKDAAFDEADTEVQKQAVFALTQLPDEEAVPLLIDLAKTHPNPKVRKQAIFWLGQTDDPRALDLLITLVREH